MKKERFPQDASLTEEIAAIIRERILDGTYAIGEKIPEGPLSNELRVSRTPIRHAFQQLAQEGLVEMRTTPSGCVGWIIIKLAEFVALMFRSPWLLWSGELGGMTSV